MEDRIEKKNCEEYLPCQLTEVEILSYSRELAKQNQDLAATEDRKKNVMADITAQMKKLEAEININARKISTGEEHRYVKCIWEYNYTRGFKRLIRLDTSDVVKQKELDQTDRQTTAVVN
jgi:hypothetical protein